jgi:hypothetical protein
LPNEELLFSFSNVLLLMGMKAICLLLCLLLYGALPLFGQLAGFRYLHPFEPQQQLPILDVPDMQQSRPDLLFLGKEGVLYDLRGLRPAPPYPYAYHSLDGDDPAMLEGAGTGTLFVFVDTTHLLSQPFYPQRSLKMPVSLWGKKQKTIQEQVQAYPVYIWNRGTETALIPAEDGSINPRVEAKDAQGIWRLIDYQVHSYCGNSYWLLLLRSDYYLITSIYRYSGDFKTELRVAIGKHYSSPFRGSINKSQFINQNPDPYH